MNISLPESLKIIENLKDDADTIANKSAEVFRLLKEIQINEHVKNTMDLNIGDYFEDNNGEIGIFTGCKSSGKHLWGRLLTKKHYGYVYPVRKISHDEAIKAIAKGKHK